MDVDLARYRAQIAKWDMAQLRKEYRRLQKARDGWLICLRRWGIGEIMVKTARAMMAEVSQEARSRK